MKYQIEVSDEALANDPDLLRFMEAVQLAVNRMMHSYYKHPYRSEREQAIREKQEEIAWLVAATAYYGRSATPAQRILSILTAQLDDLKRGMR